MATNVERAALPPATFSISRYFNNESRLGYLLLTPALVLLGIFVAYPFAFGIWLALSSATIGHPGRFIGLANFSYILQDPVFIRTIQNTFAYTFVTVVFKLGLGLMMALVLNVDFRFNRFTRAAMLLPWIIPTVLSTLAWLWMFDSTFSIFNWLLARIGIHGPGWLGESPWPMISLMMVNIWRGTPFFGVSLLAGMKMVPQELYEAAVVDGAGPVRRWLHVTLPTIRPVILITTLLSIIMTFADFQVIWILTKGGPLNQTQVFSTYAYQVGIQSTDIGVGAAVSLFMFPILCVTIGVVLWLLRKD
ncbi:MAG: sugar ABC transporter permease [Candidatus Velthaea sp.]